MYAMQCLTDCATSVAEKLHGPIRHTSGFTINNHLKSSAGLHGVVFNLKNKTTTDPEANKKHVFNINTKARVSGNLKSKQNLIEHTGTSRTGYLGFSDTSCVI